MNDERDRIDFETPQVLADALPERITAPDHLRRCSPCGATSPALPAAQLTVIKHRHASQPKGHLRLYCPEHASAVSREWQVGIAGYRSASPVRICCSMEVPLTGVCDSCGQAVAA